MSIQTYLDKIRNAIYGKDVRQALHDGLEECYRTASVDHDNANMEVVRARGIYPTLGNRLDQTEDTFNHKVWGMANMGQDVKESMTGGSVAVVGVNTILNDNIVDHQISAQKISQEVDYIFEANLATELITGEYINTTGGVVVDSNYPHGRTDYIEVEVGKKYAFHAYHTTPSLLGFYYDDRKHFIKVADITLTNQNKVYKTTVPYGAKYLVVNWAKPDVDAGIFFVSEMLDEYSYPWLRINSDNLTDDAMSHTQEKILETLGAVAKGGVFYPDLNVKEDYYVHVETGVEIQYPSVGIGGVTDFIPVLVGDMLFYRAYTTDPRYNGSIYDAQKNKIGNLESPAVEGGIHHTEITDPRAKFVRVNFSSRYKPWEVYIESNKIVEMKRLVLTQENIPDNSVSIEKLTSETIEELKTVEIPEGSVTLKELGQDVIDYIQDPTQEPNTQFSNLKTTWIGDSITAGVGTTASDKRYSELVVKGLGMSPSGYQNLGTSGSVIARKQPHDTGWSVKSVVERICDEGQIRDNQDIIFCLGGVNDLARATPFSTLADSLEYYRINGSWDDTTFYGALHRLFTYVRDNHPTSQFIFISTIHYDMENNRHPDRILKDYIDIIREMCEYYAIPLIDLYKNLPLDPKNTHHRVKYTANSGGVSPDGCHPSDAGNKLMADYIEKWLKNNYVS